MALPQDGQNANALATVKEVPAGKKLIFVDPTTNEGGIITLEDLTTQILKKLTSQTFTLDQGTKTLPAALNELNSNRLTGLAVKTNETAILPIHVYSSALILGTVNSNVFGFYLVSRGETESIYITPLTKNSKSDDFTITPIDAYKVSIQTKINTEMKVIY